MQKYNVYDAVFIKMYSGFNMLQETLLFKQTGSIIIKYSGSLKWTFESKILEPKLHRTFLQRDSLKEASHIRNNSSQSAGGGGWRLAGGGRQAICGR